MNSHDHISDDDDDDDDDDNNNNNNNNYNTISATNIDTYRNRGARQ
jgi:hypothetical protein